MTSIHIVVKIDAEQPLELLDFLSMFSALSSQYERYVRARHPELDGAARIYIHQLREGSIIADLIPFALLLVAHMDHILVVEQFVRQYASRISAYFQKGGRAKDVTKSDLSDFMQGVVAIANDPNGKAEIQAVMYEERECHIRAAVLFNTKQARVALEEIEQHRRELERRESADYENVLMTFYQSNLKDAAKSGERGVIEAVTEKPLPIVYASDLARQRVKSEILFGNRNIYKLGFFVDVNVETLQGRPVAYRLVEVRDVIELPEN